jgi:hypothetical protein
MSDGNHLCFGCGKQLNDGDQHIHVTLDEFIADQGIGSPLGLDDLFTFAYCKPCTVESPDSPWRFHAHEVGGSVDV